MIVKNAEQLVTCSGFCAKKGIEMSQLHIIENGAVVVEDGLITDVGVTPDILAAHNEKDHHVIDAKGKAVLPGFVDSHTHFVFGGYRAEEFSWRLRGDSYMDIMNRGGGIASSVKSTRKASFEELYGAAEKRLNSMLSFGVTTVEGKSGYGLDFETEIRQLKVMKALNLSHPMDVVATFLGPHAVLPEYKECTDEFIDQMIVNVLGEVAEKELAEFCDIFCEKSVFSVEQSRKFLSAGKKLGMGVKIHADEIVQLGGAELAAELSAVSADHLLKASDAGLLAMANQDVVATLLPGTAFSLKEPYAGGRKMIDMGLAVALATDLNPGSCHTESIPLIIALATLQMRMTTEEVITALTINGAAALGRAGRVGSIDPGKQGDLCILEFPSYHYLPYHMAISCVEKVVKNGELVFDKEVDSNLIRQ